MKRVAVILRSGGAALLSAVTSILGFLLVGAFLPMWIMILLYGRRGVQDAPAHGGAILLATLPIAGVLSLCAFCILTPVFYRRLSARSGN
jgi:predicted outer membrane lipoprotein